MITFIHKNNILYYYGIYVQQNVYLLFAFMDSVPHTYIGFTVIKIQIGTYDA